MPSRTNDSSLWRAFEDSALTHSAAHYLTTVAHLRKRQGYARVTDVAEELRVSRGAASRAISLLKERGWVCEDPHRMLELSAGGQDLARRVERNFLVVQCFLEDILGVPAEVAREDACKLEHLFSPSTTRALFRLIRALEGNKTLLERVKQELRAVEFDCAERGLCPVCEHYEGCIEAENRPRADEKPPDGKDHCAACPPPSRK